MVIKRLTEKHPLNQKLEKIFDLMDELKISIEIGPYSLYIKSQDFPDMDFELKDLESDESPISTLPPCFEYKITRYVPDPPKIKSKEEIKEELVKDLKQKIDLLNKEYEQVDRNLLNYENKLNTAKEEFEKNGPVIREQLNKLRGVIVASTMKLNRIVSGEGDVEEIDLE